VSCCLASSQSPMHPLHGPATKIIREKLRLLSAVRLPSFLYLEVIGRSLILKAQLHDAHQPYRDTFWNFFKPRYTTSSSVKRTIACILASLDTRLSSHLVLLNPTHSIPATSSHISGGEPEPIQGTRATRKALERTPGRQRTAEKRSP
jgi:hypothetical protein